GVPPGLAGGLQHQRRDRTDQYRLGYRFVPYRQATSPPLVEWPTWIILVSFVLPHFGYFQNVTPFANNSLCKLDSSFCLCKLAAACDQHYPKTRLPSHHLRVRGGCLVEWDGLDHRRYPTQGTETKRGVSSGGVSRQRAGYLALAEYEIHARDFDRLRSNAE